MPCKGADAARVLTRIPRNRRPLSHRPGHCSGSPSESPAYRPHGPTQRKRRTPPLRFLARSSYRSAGALTHSQK
jgi:hypothetical protein